MLMFIGKVGIDPNTKNVRRKENFDEKIILLTKFINCST